MAKNLVIVESPAKAKTINKYLGKDYLVKASIGHIKDLPSKGLGVDVDDDFKPTYEVIPDTKKRNNKRIVAELKKAAKEADAIYLAADPDREGEAICQHLAEEIDRWLRLRDQGQPRDKSHQLPSQPSSAQPQSVCCFVSWYRELLRRSV